MSSLPVEVDSVPSEENNLTLPEETVMVVPAVAILKDNNDSFQDLPVPSLCFYPLLESLQAPKSVIWSMAHEEVHNTPKELLEFLS